MSYKLDPRRFCGYYDNIRFWMQKPFALNDRSVATNGHILITWPGTMYLAEPIATTATKESIQEIINTARGIAPHLYQPLQPLKLPVGDTCADCNGTGKNKPALCRDCDGEGCEKCREGVIPQLKTDHPCPDCLGFGAVRPVNERFYPEQCQHPYDPDYLRLISEMPEVQIYEQTTEVERHFEKISYGMLYFKSKELYGALCGMKP